jgi:hypothetical protein
MKFQRVGWLIQGWSLFAEARNANKVKGGCQVLIPAHRLLNVLTLNAVEEGDLRPEISSAPLLIPPSL